MKLCKQALRALGASCPALSAWSVCTSPHSAHLVKLEAKQATAFSSSVLLVPFMFGHTAAHAAGCRDRRVHRDRRQHGA
jgi:hypothetical protein